MSEREDESRVHERVRALEESQGFAERLTEELGDEVRALGRRVTELSQRLSRLEATLSKREADAGGDAPDGDTPK